MSMPAILLHGKTAARALDDELHFGFAISDMPYLRSRFISAYKLRQLL